MIEQTGQARPTSSASPKCRSKTAIGVGFIQCLAMIPGVSRSGATIMGGLSLGVERRTAAEFSFFLAIPTMLGATTLELVKHHDTLMAGASGVGFGAVAVGFVVSFVVAIVVVQGFVALHLAPRLRALRLVPDRRRRGCARLADDALSLSCARRASADNSAT